MKFLKRALLKDVPEGSTIKLTPQGRFYTVGKDVSPNIVLNYNGKTFLHGRYLSVYVCRPTQRAVDEGESAPLQAESTLEVLPIEEADTTPALRN